MRITKTLLIVLIAIILWTIIILFNCPSSTAGTTTNIMKFGAGIAIAYAIHEAGHYTTASVTEQNLKWEFGEYNQAIHFQEQSESSNNISGALLYASGLTAQIITSEIILQSDIDKNNDFIRGMMFWNIINPIFYSLDYWFIRRSNQQNDNYHQGDIEGLEHYTNEKSADIFAATMSILAISQGYRFLKTQNWTPDWIKSNKVDFTCNYNSNNDFSALVTINF